MNDIEILEEMIKDAKEFEKQFNTAEIEQGTEGQKRIQAIENLIQRNKDLEQILELTSKSLDNISYDQIPIAIQELLNLYNKEKEKNKNAIDFINERKKTVNKDMAEGTRLQVGTFMWQVDDLLEILEE